MQKYTTVPEIHTAIHNETFSLKTTNGQMTVEVLDADFDQAYAEGFVVHDLTVKLTNENGVSEEADIIVKEKHDNLSCAFGDLRNSREIKAFMDSIVQSINAHVTKNYHAAGVKSLLRQAAIDHNEK